MRRAVIRFEPAPVDERPLPVDAALAVVAVTAPRPPEVLLRQEPPLTDRDELVLLLHLTAEIEHALLVEYLYAAYSLDPARPLQGRWRRILVEIAREEMAHLLSVQNALRALAGPLNFDRDEEPFRDFYPFPFELAPFSVRTAARYVLTEMPDPSLLDPAELKQLEEDAEVEQIGGSINRVGALFALMLGLTGTIDDTSLFRDSEEAQADPQAWRFGKMIIDRVVDRPSLYSLLDRIGQQGEGPGEPSGSDEASHFRRFLLLWRELKKNPDEKARPVPIDPTTSDKDAGGYISNPAAQAWANFFNTRYRMLLADLAHMLYEPASASLLGQWARVEMYRLSAIADRLTALPQKPQPDGNVAAPPFALPYTLELPDREIDRWRHHERLIAESNLRIRRLDGNDPIVASTAAADGARLQIIRRHLRELYGMEPTSR